MYENVKYKEFYFFTIYKSTIVYFDNSKRKLLSDNRVSLLHYKQNKTVETVTIQKQ